METDEEGIGGVFDGPGLDPEREEGAEKDYKD